MTTRNKGRIDLILGPMFAGKTTELMRQMRRYKIALKSCIIVKSSIDTRYEKEYCCSHDSIKMEALTTSKLMGDIATLKKYDVVGIDEGQFFEDLADAAKELALNGAHVIIAALDGTFQQQMFRGIIDVIPHADTIIKLSSVCMSCGADAIYTDKLESSIENNNDSIINVGGSDKYIAVCRQCHMKKKN
jgi:thymidine kinase